MTDPTMGCLLGVVKALRLFVVLLTLIAGILIGVFLASVSTILV